VCQTAEVFSLIIVPTPPASLGSKEKNNTTDERCATGNDRQRYLFSVIERGKQPDTQ
jgi:hypothetical protein